MRLYLKLMATCGSGKLLNIKKVNIFMAGYFKAGAGQETK